MLFKDYDCLAQQSAMFDALEQLPAYRLAYDSDPATAALLVRKILTDCDASEPEVTASTLMATV
jgi:hypothetical protein